MPDDLMLARLENARNPALLAWPPTFAIEVAMHTGTPKEICEEYNISREEWEQIKVHPAFIAEVAGVMEALREEGLDFKMRAKLQAVDLLRTSWAMIHSKGDEVPASVKADLIKATIRWAGYDQKATGGGDDNRTAFQINIKLDR
jgi:hypothetical protein